MTNPTNISPKILAGDIKRYLREGVSIEEIQKGAFENGISEEMWEEAVKIQERKPRRRLFFFSGFFLLLLMVFGGLFLTDNINDSRFSGEFEIPEKEIEVEVPVVSYSDPAFQKKIDQGEITVHKQYSNPQKIENFEGILSFIQSEFPDFSGIKKISLEFGSDGILKNGMVIFWDRSSQEKIFLQNTKRPYQISGGVLFSNTKMGASPSQMLLTTLWDSLFEKIDFSAFEKTNLTFDIEIYSKDDTKYVRASVLYPESEKSSSIEIDFYEYQNVLKETKTAFGRDIKISTGKFQEKYPIKRRPVPRRVSQ